MMPSPDGKQLACASETGVVELFDFDNSTGVVSHVIPLPGLQWSYGVCFSPDNSKLYVGAALQNQIDQYDLSSGDSLTIRLSRKPVYQGPVSPNQLGFLQLGPDGKIYVSQEKQTSLTVIASPNLPGKACNPIPNSFSLGSGLSSLGLPNMSYSYAPNRVTNITLTAPAVHGAPGDTILIPIALNVSPLSHLPFSVDIALNQTIFSVVDRSLPERISGDDRIVTITATADSSVTIYYLKCVIGLGDSLDVSLGLENGLWSSACPSTLSESSGSFHLDNVCPAGGDRLFDPFGTFTLKQSVPNPANGSTSISFSTPEDTYTELFLVDLLGRRVKTLAADVIKHGSYTTSFDASGRAAGVYYNVLQTSDKTLPGRLVVAR